MPSGTFLLNVTRESLTMWRNEGHSIIHSSAR